MTILYFAGKYGKEFLTSVFNSFVNFMRFIAEYIWKILIKVGKKLSDGFTTFKNKMKEKCNCLRRNNEGSGKISVSDLVQEKAKEKEDDKS